VKGLSVLCLLGVVYAIGAGIYGSWPWWLSVAVGLVCLWLGPKLWQAAEARSRSKLLVKQYRYERGEVSEDELMTDLQKHDRDFG